MKNRKIYHTNFSRQIDTVVWEYTLIDDTARTKLAEIVFEANLDYEDHFGNYNTIIITDSEQMSKYLRILEANMIFQHTKDISRNILENQFDIKKVEKLIKPSLLKIFNHFCNRIDEWILENTDLDIVLDLINEYGLENLREIDKKFLENYANK